LYDTSLEYRPAPKVTLTAYLGYTQGLLPWNRFILTTRMDGSDISSFFIDSSHAYAILALRGDNSLP